MNDSPQYGKDNAVFTVALLFAALAGFFLLWYLLKDQLLLDDEWRALRREWHSVGLFPFVRGHCGPGPSAGGRGLSHCCPHIKKDVKCHAAVGPLDHRRVAIFVVSTLLLLPALIHSWGGTFSEVVQSTSFKLKSLPPAMTLIAGTAQPIPFIVFWVLVIIGAVEIHGLARRS